MRLDLVDRIRRVAGYGPRAFRRGELLAVDVDDGWRKRRLRATVLKPGARAVQLELEHPAGRIVVVDYAAITSARRLA